MKLFVVRHGQTIENEQGILMGHHHGTLSELGKKQAKETAEKLENYSFAHIYSSDLSRCVDSAEIIKEHHPDTPLTFIPELRELNMGDFQGEKRDNIDWEELGNDVMTRRPPNGETLQELRDRVNIFIENLLEDHINDEICFVTHAGVIRQTLSLFSETSSEYIYHNIPIKNAGVYEVQVNKDMTGAVLNVPELK